MSMNLDMNVSFREQEQRYKVHNNEEETHSPHANTPILLLNPVQSSS